MEVELKVDASLWSGGSMRKHTPESLVGKEIHMVPKTLILELVERRRATSCQYIIEFSLAGRAIFREVHEELEQA